MPRRIITEITEQQEAMLPRYQEKWRSPVISTEPIDTGKAASVIKAAYSVSDFPEPEILFYESPFAAIQAILAIDDYKGYSGKDIHSKISDRTCSLFPARNIVLEAQQSSLYKRQSLLRWHSKPEA